MRLSEACPEAEPALKSQLHELRVEGRLDGDGSTSNTYLQLYPQAGEPVSRHLEPEPAIALGLDSDGGPVEVVLLVENGFMRELEVFRLDGAPLRSLPATNHLTVYETCGPTPPNGRHFEAPGAI